MPNFFIDWYRFSGFLPSDLRRTASKPGGSEILGATCDSAGGASVTCLLICFVRISERRSAPIRFPWLERPYLCRPLPEVRPEERSARLHVVDLKVGSVHVVLTGSTVAWYLSCASRNCRYPHRSFGAEQRTTLVNVSLESESGGG